MYLTAIEERVTGAIIDSTESINQAIELAWEIKRNGINAVSSDFFGVDWVEHTDPECGGTCLQWAVIGIGGGERLQHLNQNAGHNRAQWATDFRYNKLDLKIRWQRVRRAISMRLKNNLHKNAILDPDTIRDIQGCYSLGINPLPKLRTLKYFRNFQPVYQKNESRKTGWHWTNGRFNEGCWRYVLQLDNGHCLVFRDNLA